MTFENRAAVVAARDLTECNIVRQALDQLLEQGDAAKRDPNSPWRTTYGGRTEDNNSAIDRKDLHFSDKPSGAKKLQAFLRERERLAAFMTVHSRLLANGEDNFETEQLEALLGQFAGVGGVVGLNVAHMGPWRYGKKGDLTALRFCMRASRNGHGGATIREATRPCRRTLRRSVPRRTHPNNRYAPQVLDDDNLYQWWPDGHTALRDLAESSWAPANFVSTDKLLTVTVTQVLQKFSENGAKARAAKRLAVDEGLKKLGLDKAHFSYAVKDVSPYEAAAAAAILESVASCDTYELKVTAVVAVEQVFQAVDEPLDRILLGLRIDGSYERHELAEVLEECRDVMRHSGGEAHVAALIEYARADVEALANLSSDDVLESLVKKSEELRPGAGPSWTPIADALNELGVPRTGGKEWERRYVHSHYLSLHSNKTPLTEDERRMVHALEWELGHDWAEIARRLGNGRDSNKIKCYWHDHGRHRQGVECGLCKKWRLLPKSAAKVDEDAPWACKDGGRSCDERCDYVLPETVEEAPVEAPADAAAVVSTPMALGDDDALQQPPPPDVVEQTAPPPRGSEDEDTSMTEAPAADAAPESLAAVDGGGSAHLVQQPAARAAPPSADPIVELDLSFAELKLKLAVDDASDFEDAVAALFARVRAARAAATNSMNI